MNLAVAFVYVSSYAIDFANVDRDSPAAGPFHAVVYPACGLAVRFDGQHGQFAHHVAVFATFLRCEGAVNDPV